MIVKLLHDTQEDLEILKQCVENSGRLKYLESNAKLFIESSNTFFFVVVDEEDNNKPLAFTYGYIIPKPEDISPSVWVYALEVLNGTQKKGVGTFLIAHLRTFAFYENPFSNIFFLCDKENMGMYETLKRSNAYDMINLSPLFIPNENLDENGNWKGVPSDGNVNIQFSE